MEASSAYGDRLDKVDGWFRLRLGPNENEFTIKPTDKECKFNGFCAVSYEPEFNKETAILNLRHGAKHVYRNQHVPFIYIKYPLANDYFLMELRDYIGDGVNATCQQDLHVMGDPSKLILQSKDEGEIYLNFLDKQAKTV